MAPWEAVERVRDAVGHDLDVLVSPGHGYVRIRIAGVARDARPAYWFIERHPHDLPQIVEDLRLTAKVREALEIAEGSR